MSFLKRKARIMGAVASAVMSVALLGSSLVYAGMADNYRSWKQTDSSWSSMTLGTNGGTVADFGCAVTSAAMLMVKSGAVKDSDFNPAVLIEYLNQNKGFSADGDLNWDALAWYAPDFKFDSRINLFGTDEEKTERIQELLDDGYFMIAQVKNNSHFVAIDTVRGSEIVMLDPGSTSSSLNEKYGIGSMTSLRVFKLAKHSAVRVPEQVQETEAQEQVTIPETAPETAPELIPAMPETAPVVPEIIVTTTTEMTTTAIISTMPATTMSDSAVETSSSTAVTSMTTKQTTMPEIIIMTKATTATTATVMTETTKPEIVMPDAGAVPEILIDPITEECESDKNDEDTADAVQIVILETAPAIAPDTEETVMTEETKAVYVPDDQAQAVLFQVKEQNLYMTVRFYIQKDLNLLATPDANAEILNVVPANTCLDVVEIDEDFKWGKVLYENQEGWISLHFTSMSPQNGN